MKQLKKLKISVPCGQSMVDLLGQKDEFLKVIEDEFSSQILVRGNEITISGQNKEAQQVEALFRELIELLEQGEDIDNENLSQVIQLVRREEAGSGKGLAEVIIFHRSKAIRAKTPGQHEYVQAIHDNVITFVIGPAGTGKTYLAMAMAVQALKSKTISRIILTRPAVEAGEKLGFLPGDLYEKVDPYLRPLYDALYDMMEVEQFRRLMDQGTIEIAPLAYMRGRTLNDSFIILDEAQNTSPEQIKMFLTRLGFGSKVVVTGDVTQSDLPKSDVSGLVAVEQIVTGIEGTAFIRLSAKDVVRHKIVQRIVEAYKKFDDRERSQAQDKQKAGDEN